MKKREPWNKGKKMTQATKDRISASKKGTMPWNKGLDWPGEVREKISESKKGMPAWNKGRSWSTSVKKKISKTKLFPDKKFKDLYDILETKFGSNYSKIDQWIIDVWPDVQIIECKRGKETLPTHIRHCYHHKRHGVYTNEELVLVIKKLSKLINKV